jgi:hypothetical protein
VVPGSFGTQTALFTPRVAAAGHDVAISAAVGLQGTPLLWNGMLVYDSTGDVLGGWEQIPRNARLHFRDEPGGLIVTLVDPPREAAGVIRGTESSHGGGTGWSPRACAL